MANVKLLGTEQIPNTLEAPLAAISSTDAIAQEFTVDPTLPVVGRKYLAPFPEIVIPKFRIVGVKVTTKTTTGNPVLTLATSGTSSYVSPIGVTAPVQEPAQDTTHQAVQMTPPEQETVKAEGTVSPPEQVEIAEGQPTPVVDKITAQNEVIKELEKLSEMKNLGLITDGEFEQKKKALLN